MTEKEIVVEEPLLKKQKVEENETETKPAETTEASNPPAKVFGGGTSGWASALSSGNLGFLSNQMSSPASIFGQSSSSKVSFGSLSTVSDSSNVFLAKEGEESSNENKWVSPFSAPEIFGTSKPEEKEKEKNHEEPPPTGEENERTDFSIRGKLFVYDVDKKDWRERGVGIMKINVSVENKSCRLVMRSDGILRLILNAKLFDGITVELASDKAVRFIVIEGDKKPSTYLLRTRTKDEAKNFINAIKEKVTITEPPKRPETLTQTSKPKETSNGHEEKEAKDDEGSNSKEPEKEKEKDDEDEDNAENSGEDD